MNLLIRIIILIQVLPLFVDAQNVGIGTSNPAKKLDVNGSVNIGDSLLVGSKLGVGLTLPLSNLHVLHDASSGPLQGLRIDNSFGTVDNNWWNIHTQGGSGDLFFYSGDSPTTASLNFVLESDGDVGIGTANPEEKLEVIGNVKISEGITVENLKGIKNRNVVVDQNGKLLSAANPIKNQIKSQRISTKQQNIFTSPIGVEIFGDFGPDVLGGSTDDAHMDEVIIRGIDHFLFKNLNSASGFPEGSVKNRFLTFHKSIGPASVPLLTKFNNNETINEVILTFRYRGGNALEFLILTLTNAKIQEFNMAIKHINETEIEMMECFLLSYDSITYSYVTQNEDGSAGETFTQTILWSY